MHIYYIQMNDEPLAAWFRRQVAKSDTSGLVRQPRILSEFGTESDEDFSGGLASRDRETRV